MEPSLLLLFSLATLVVAAAVVVSGFGLASALTPLFLLVFEIKTAILFVALVHFANNLFRWFVFRAHLDRGLLRRFGGASVTGAILGSLLQKHAGSEGLEIGLGVLLVLLGTMEFLPLRWRWQIPPQFDRLGGLLAGLVGGLIGNQGALRSAYLLHYPLSKEAFIATGTAIGCFIDATRIPIYLFHYRESLAVTGPSPLWVIPAAFIGTLVGRELVKKVSPAWFRKLVAGLVTLTGLLLIVSWPDPAR